MHDAVSWEIARTKRGKIVLAYQRLDATLHARG
jgi:hypothetical protein